MPKCGLFLRYVSLWYTCNLQTSKEITEATVSPRNILFEYYKFFRTCVGIFFILYGKCKGNRYTIRILCALDENFFFQENIYIITRHKWHTVSKHVYVRTTELTTRAHNENRLSFRDKEKYCIFNEIFTEISHIIRVWISWYNIKHSRRSGCFMSKAVDILVFLYESKYS